MAEESKSKKQKRPPKRYTREEKSSIVNENGLRQFWEREHDFRRFAYAIIEARSPAITRRISDLVKRVRDPQCPDPGTYSRMMWTAACKLLHIDVPPAWAKEGGEKFFEGVTDQLVYTQQVTPRHADLPKEDDYLSPGRAALKNWSPGDFRPTHTEATLAPVSVDASPEYAEAKLQFAREPGKLGSPLRAIEWCFEVMDDPEVTPLDAPSRGAWSLLRWVRMSGINKSQFYTTFLPRVLPNRAQIDALDTMRDTGDSVKELATRLLKIYAVSRETEDQEPEEAPEGVDIA